MYEIAQVSKSKVLIFLSITMRDLFFEAALAGQNMLRAAQRLREMRETFETFEKLR